MLCRCPPHAHPPCRPGPAGHACADAPPTRTLLAGLGRLDMRVLMPLFFVAAVLGDAVNYSVGAGLGTWAVSKGLVNKDHIAKTEKFYDKYGAKTVVLAR